MDRYSDVFAWLMFMFGFVNVLLEDLCLESFHLVLTLSATLLLAILDGSLSEHCHDPALKHLNTDKKLPRALRSKILEHCPDITLGQKSVTLPFLSQSPYRVGSGPLKDGHLTFRRSKRQETLPWSPYLPSLRVDTSWMCRQRIL